MERIETVPELVAALGGTCAVAEWLDVGASTVSNWKALGFVPRAYHLEIYFECQSRRIQIEPGALGLSEWPGKGPFHKATATPIEMTA